LFFDEAFTVTSRSKTIAALRLCVLDGNASTVRSFKFIIKGGYDFKIILATPLTPGFELSK
jgi:hypothetical protein